LYGNGVYQELTETVWQPFRYFASAFPVGRLVFKPLLLLPQKTTDFFGEFEQFLMQRKRVIGRRKGRFRWGPRREVDMTKRVNAIAGTAVVVLAAWTLGAGLIWAKKKSALPQVVLNAKTVFVMVDPNEAILVNDPGGNRTAREDVEKALMEWGRLKPTMTMSQADLVIVVRKGDKQAMNPTVAGQSPNDRPVIVQGTDDTIRIGGQLGKSPDAAQNGGPLSPKSGMGGEIGPTEDMFSVYLGGTEDALKRGPLWRYARKDALKSPGVPAVAEFKKAVDEAVKQQQKAGKSQQP
jgi:hypothetical protein